MTSKYLETFRKLGEEAENCYQIFGDYILVERIPDEEMKTKSGIHLPVTGDRHSKWDHTDRPVFCHVLAVGDGFYDEDGETVPANVEVGDVILIGQLSANWFKTFGTLVAPGEIGLTRESEIKMRFYGKEGYAKVLGILGDSVQS